MADPIAMSDAHEAELSELAALGMDVARKVHGKLMAAEEASEIADLALAFSRIARTVRQTLALQARLARDARRVEAEVAEAACARRRVRRQQVEARMRRMINHDRDPSEAMALRLELYERLDAWEPFEDFDADPVEVQIDRLRQDLGLAPRAPTPSTGDAAPQATEAAAPPPFTGDAAAKPTEGAQSADPFPPPTPYRDPTYHPWRSSA